MLDHKVGRTSYLVEGFAQRRNTRKTDQVRSTWNLIGAWEFNHE